jgi:hypothetical protein
VYVDFQLRHLPSVSGAPDVVSKFVRSGRVALAMLAGVIGAAGAIIWPNGGTAHPTDAPMNCPVTAATTHGWGAPNRTSTFDTASDLGQWWLYDGPGHAGNGRRTPEAIAVAAGLLTITGDAQGNSGGMTLKGPGQVYGRWEVCAKSPAAAPDYHSVLLLWPDAEDWPMGGEIDFMEISDPQRQIVDANLHYGPDDERQGGTVQIDASQWHSWAVEWTPDHIATYVDGVQWWETTDVAHFPPGRMHLCMQLDNFGGDIRGGGRLVIDSVRRYGVE